MVAAVACMSGLAGLAAGRCEVDQLEAQWLAQVGAYDRSYAWQSDGHLSAAAAIAKLCKMNPGAARAAVELARKLEQLPETRRAFDQGAISKAHAAVIADAYTEKRAPALAGFEPLFVNVARTENPKALREYVRLVTDAIDGDNGSGTDKDEAAKNRLHVSVLHGRGVLDGSFDGESTEIVKAALDAMQADLKQAGDERKRSVKQAEALVEICRRSLASDKSRPPARRRGRPNLSVVVAVRAYETDHPELVATIRAEAEHTGRISRATLERLSCDCAISRIVTDGPSKVLDVGRTTRNISDALWRALVVRDRHCQWPDCERPAGWCEAHHIQYWEHGGPTDLENLKLLCWQHHRQQHQHDNRAHAGQHRAG